MSSQLLTALPSVHDKCPKGSVMIIVEGNTGNRAYAEAEFSGAPEAVLARAREAALRIRRSQTRTSTNEAVEVTVGMSFQSWGEVVRITAQEDGQMTREPAIRSTRLLLLVTWVAKSRRRHRVSSVWRRRTNSAISPCSNTRPASTSACASRSARMRGASSRMARVSATASASGSSFTLTTLRLAVLCGYSTGSAFHAAAAVQVRAL